MFLQPKHITITELIGECRKGNRKAQELLYKQLSSKMLGVCMRYATSKMEAEDMLQNGFMKLFQKLEDFRGEGSFEGWARRIMVNSAIEYYRKHYKMMQIMDIQELGYEQLMEADVTGKLGAQELLILIQQLPPGYRMVFNMYAIEGYSHKEIAGMAGITEGASKSQLSRARAILKEQIEKLERNLYKYAR